MNLTFVVECIVQNFYYESLYHVLLCKLVKNGSSRDKFTDYSLSRGSEVLVVDNYMTRQYP